MSERPRRSSTQPSALPEAASGDLSQGGFKEEQNREATESVAKAKPFHSAHASNKFSVASSSLSRSEDVARFGSQEGWDSRKLQAPSFSLRGLVERALQVLSQRRLVNLTEGGIEKKVVQLVFLFATGEDSSAQESLRNLYKILASDEFFVRTFQSIVQSLKNLVPEHLDSNQRKDFILDALKLSFVRDGSETKNVRSSDESQSSSEEVNTSKTVKTRSSLGGNRNMVGGALDDYAELYTEEDQEVVANLSVTGINNNVAYGFTEELEALLSSLTERLRSSTRAHLLQWDQESLAVLATGLHWRITNLLERAKDIAVKRSIEPDIMSHLQKKERQDPCEQLDEIRQEELRQVQAIMEESQKREEEGEEWRDSQQADSSKKRKASDGSLEMGENMKKPRKRQSRPTLDAETTMKSSFSAVAGLVKKRREQARLIALNESSVDTKTSRSASHEKEPESTLFQTKPEETNVVITVRDVIFVLERDATCRKASWFYSKYNSLRNAS